MAFKNLMNNYFYGKQGQGDFTVANLPQNRRQLFGDILKVRWSSLFGVNLLYLIIWIPAIAWCYGRLFPIAQGAYSLSYSILMH